MDGKVRIVATFCPECYHPLDDDSNDDGRLCPACRWFGDKSEVCHNPPAPTNLELAFAQLLAIYRDVCRMELLAEQLIESSSSKYDHALIAIKARVAHARHSILYFFRGTHGKTKNSTDETEN